jgi:threonine dehydratase
MAKEYLVVTTVGPDKRGIVEKITEVMLNQQANIEESRMARLGGEFVKTPFEEVARVFSDRGFEGVEGRLVHPFSDPAVIAGNGTIGLEIVEDLPDVDAVVVPYGGGGLSCGIASAIRALRPAARVFAAAGRSGMATLDRIGGFVCRRE